MCGRTLSRTLVTQKKPPLARRLAALRGRREKVPVAVTADYSPMGSAGRMVSTGMVGILDHLFGYGTEKNAVNALAAVGAHDNDVHLFLVGAVQNFLGRIADEHLAFGFHAGEVSATKASMDFSAPVTISPTKFSMVLGGT